MDFRSQHLTQSAESLSPQHTVSVLGKPRVAPLTTRRLREKFYPEKSSTPRRSLPRKKSTPDKIHNFDPIKLILEKLKALTR